MLSVFAVLLAAAGSVHAAQRGPSDDPGPGYPARPIRIIVPFPPGGSNDIMGRYFGHYLTERFGRPVMIDNRGGADGRPRAVNRVPACGMRTSASRDARR